MYRDLIVLFLALLLACAGVFYLWRVSERAMGKTLRKTRVYLVTFLSLFIFPPLGVVYAEAGRNYVSYMRSAKTESLHLVLVTAGIHLGLTLLLGTVGILLHRLCLWARRAKGIQEERGTSCGEVGCSLGAVIIIFAVMYSLLFSARGTSAQNACINNLRMIDSGKEQAALVERWAIDAPCVVTVVNQYIKGNTTPVCPAGGIYTYGRMDALPACDYAGTTTHRLPRW